MSTVLFLFNPNRDHLLTCCFLIDEGFIDQDQVVDEDSFDARRVEREHQKLDRRRREMDDRDAEQIAAEFKERHNRSQAARFKGSSENTPQRLLMPGVEDPNLWQIRVKVRVFLYLPMDVNSLKLT